MTTDNRTNEPTAEQIVRGVRKLLNRYSLRGDVPCDEIDKLIDDSEAGLLSEGAPSEAQVEAAAEAIHNLMQGDPSFKDSGRKREMRIYARAALVAAQGAAPQAESEDNVTCRCGHGTGSHDFSDPQESCREIVCDCRGWFGVSPVLPSSGVDEDERDAALEAIERIRQAVSGHPECDRYEEGDVISCGWKSAYASVVAALDGAPEPEWEWGFAIREHPHNSVLEASREDAERRVAKWNKYASPKNGVLVRRRKVGPWLPVEGEKP